MKALIVRGAVCILASASLTAGGADLVVNGSFDTALANWTLQGGVALDTTDGAPSAGSAHMVVAGNAVNVASLYQCINLVPTGVVDLLGSSFTQSVSGNANTALRVDAFDAPACAGTALGTLAGAAVSTEQGTNAIWTRFGLFNVTLNPNTQSVAISAVAIAAAPGDALDVLWDHIQFGPSGTLPVELLEFHVD